MASKDNVDILKSYKKLQKKKCQEKVDGKDGNNKSTCDRNQVNSKAKQYTK